jgi:hypothetical protein
MHQHALRTENVYMSKNRDLVEEVSNCSGFKSHPLLEEFSANYSSSAKIRSSQPTDLSYSKRSGLCQRFLLALVSLRVYARL